VSKVEKQNKKGEATTRYSLTDSQGNQIDLANKRAGKGRKGQVDVAPVVNLDDYVDKNVVVTGQGATMDRKGAKATRMVKITKVELATTPAAMPPASTPRLPRHPLPRLRPKQPAQGRRLTQPAADNYFPPIRNRSIGMSATFAGRAERPST